jgi:hypothetical protein
MYRHHSVHATATTTPTHKRTVYLEAEVRLDLLNVLNLVRVQLHHTVDDALHATQFLLEVVVGHLVAVALGDGVFQLVF